MKRLLYILPGVSTGRKEKTLLYFPWREYRQEGKDSDIFSVAEVQAGTKKLLYILPGMSTYRNEKTPLQYILFSLV
jgi:hypothetical protein